MIKIGKSRGLSRLADENGHFRMVALDQRPPMFDAIAQARGVSKDDVSFGEVASAKRLLVDVLATRCSSMLLDPNFAVPAAIDRLPPRCGLIVTLEEHRFEDTPGGRLSTVIPNWTVGKIRAMGGDAVKVLAWYRPDAEASVIARQQEFVRKIGDECRHHDIPYVLELLVYPFIGSAGHTADYVEAPGKLPALVIDSVREFARPDYGVDLLKLESPVAAAALPPRDGSAVSAEAQTNFDEVGAICRQAGLPWVLLSGGAPSDRFERVLDYAYAAGASGFLAGRTIWLDAIRSRFPDLDAVRSQLETDSVAVLERLNSLTQTKARAWSAGFEGFGEITREGLFSQMYAP